MEDKQNQIEKMLSMAPKDSHQQMYNEHNQLARAPYVESDLSNDHFGRADIDKNSCDRFGRILESDQKGLPSHPDRLPILPMINTLKYLKTSMTAEAFHSYLSQVRPSSKNDEKMSLVSSKAIAQDIELQGAIDSSQIQNEFMPEL